MNTENTEDMIILFSSFPHFLIYIIYTQLSPVFAILHDLRAKN